MNFGHYISFKAIDIWLSDGGKKNPHQKSGSYRWIFIVVQCRCVIYKEDNLRLRSLAIKVKRVHTASSVNYNRKTGREIAAI